MSSLGKSVSNMKICIPTMGNGGLREYVCEHFGRAPTFTVVDLATNEVKVIPNTSEHMGGIQKPPELIAGTEVQVVLCSGLGPWAIKMFEDLGIEVFVGASSTVMDAIKAWKEGKLQEATGSNVCKMHRH